MTTICMIAFRLESTGVSSPFIHDAHDYFPDYLAALHFKLIIPKTTTVAYEKTIYQYIPLLDANRDRDLVDLLPDFLMDHITFERQAVTKFYTRVIDALTKRRVSSS